MSNLRNLAGVPEDCGRALAIVTDADDMEYAAVAAVARWTAQSEHVSYLLVTPLAYQSAPADA